MRLTTTRIVLIYLLVGALWILTTDQLLEYFIEDSSTLLWAQTAKGWFFVSLTALLLFVLIKRYNRFLIGLKQENEGLANQAMFGVVVVQNDKIIRCNPAFASMSRLSPNQIKKAAFIDLFHSEDHNQIDLLFSKNTSSEPVEARIKSTTGDCTWVSLGLSTLKQNGDVIHQIIVSDINRKKNLQRQNDLLLRVFTTFDKRQGVLDSLEDVIRLICEELEWNYAEVWVFSTKDDKSMNRVVSWHTRDDQLALFDARSKLMAESPVKNLAPLMPVLGEINWIENLQAENPFDRSEQATEAGLKSLVSVPVSNNGNVQALLVFMSREKKARDENLRGVMLAIAEDFQFKLAASLEQLEMEKSQKRFGFAFETAGMAYWEFSPKESKFVNTIGLNTLLSIEEEHGLTLDGFTQHIHIEDRVESISKLRKAIQNQSSFNIEFRVIDRNGVTKWIWTRGEIIKDKNEEVESVSGVSIDITRRKELEREVVLQSERFLMLYEKIPVLITMFNPDIEVLTINKEFTRVLGWTQNDALNQNLMELCYPDVAYRERVLEFMQQPGLDWREFDVTAKDGSVRLQMWRNFTLMDNTNVGIGIDITEMRKNEAEIKKSHDKLQFAQKIAKLGYWEANLKTGDLNWSDSVFELFGLDKNRFELNEENFFSLIHPDDLEEFQKTIAESLTKGELNVTFRIVKPDGSIGIFQEKGEVIYDARGNPTMFTGVVYDITNVRELQKKVEYEQERFEIVARTSNDVIWDWDLESGTSWWSNGLSNLLGANHKTNVPNLTDLVHPDDKAEVDALLSEALKSNESSWQAEYRMLHKDGTSIYVINRAFIIRDIRGRALRMIGAILDITLRKKAEAELKRSEEQYRLLFEQNPFPIWIYEPKSFRFVAINDAAIIKYGYSEEEFLNMTILDVRPEEDIPYVIENVNNAEGHIYFEEWEHITKEGKVLTVEVSASQINYNGKDCRLVIINDITEQRKAEGMVISSLIEGEERERRRMARDLHDGLGQYLSAANLTFESLFDDILFQEELQKERYKHGIQLIKDAMKESRNISQNLLPKAIDDFGLALAVDSLVQELRKSTDISFVYFHRIPEDELPEIVQINLYRIIQESLQNAIKHSGCSKISIQLIEDDGEIICTVEDNGKGISEESIKNSVGIGMGSLKTRVNAMSGTLDVSGQSGKGTVLTVVIPYK